MNVTRTFTEQWYRWQIGWASMIAGMIGVLTFGFWQPPLALWAARALAMKRHEIQAKQADISWPP